MIEIKELTKRYGKKQVIKDISLVLKPCTYGFATKIWMFSRSYSI